MTFINKADEQPTVEEVVNHKDSEQLVLSHVIRIECPECGHTQLEIRTDGWTDEYVCDGCDTPLRHP